MRLSRRIRLKASIAGALVVGLVVALGSPAAAVATIEVTPTTGLTDGAVVAVTGSGFAPSAFGGVTQCNDDPSQPTVDVFGSQVPVGCSDPLGVFVTFSATGTLPSTNLTVHTGVVGPPAVGTDSSGHPAADSAADYPCPPTPAQIAAGVNCVVAVGDLSGNRATKVITFQGQQPPPTTTTTAVSATTTTTTATTTTTKATTTTTTKATTTTTTTTAVSSATTTTTAAAAVLGTQTSRGTQLPATGPTRLAVVLGLVGLAVLDLGYLIESSTHAPRRVGRRIRSWVRRGVMRQS